MQTVFKNYSRKKSLLYLRFYLEIYKILYFLLCQVFYSKPVEIFLLVLFLSRELFYIFISWRTYPSVILVQEEKISIFFSRNLTRKVISTHPSSDKEFTVKMNKLKMDTKTKVFFIDIIKFIVHLCIYLGTY